MTKLYEIIEAIQKKANPALAMSWDNVGLQIGSENKEVKKVL
ncbi:MAG: Nif3-like dinuclear metal center hexameric protein, partial [Candidatus Cloacimonadota bacterium]|nr:Nif3-like dinuclear metal center hexameric protein [Candidatus Cloacimonadota bacterium]